MYTTVVASILMPSQILLLLEVFPTFITLVAILWPLTAHLWSSILVLPGLRFLINIIPIAEDMVAVGHGQHHLRADYLLVPPTDSLGDCVGVSWDQPCFLGMEIVRSMVTFHILLNQFSSG